MRQIKSHANRVNLILDSFDTWYVEFINKLKFDDYYNREGSLLKKTIVDIILRECIREYLPAIGSETARLMEDLTGERPMITMSKGYKDGIQLTIENEFDYWYNKFSFDNKILNRQPKPKALLKTHWNLSMPRMVVKTVAGQSVDKMIVGTDSWYSPLWSNLHKALRTRLKQYSTLLATDVSING